VDFRLRNISNNRITTAFDVEHIRYSEIQSVGNPIQPLFKGVALGAKMT